MKAKIRSGILLLCGAAIGVLLGRTIPTSPRRGFENENSPFEGEPSPVSVRGTEDLRSVDLTRLGDLVKSARDELKLAVIYGRVAQLSLGEIERMLDKVLSSTDPDITRLREEFEDALIQRLLELDPAVASEVALTRRSGETAHEAEKRADRWVRPVFTALAECDLAEAKRLAANLPIDGWLRRQAVGAIIDSAEIDDYRSLITWAKSADPGFDDFGDSVSDFTNMSAYMITPDNDLFTRWAKADIAEAQAYVLGLESGAERNQGLAGIAEALAVTDPNAAVEFAESLSNATEQSAVWYRTIHLLASTRPEDAASLLDQLPKGLVKQSAVNVLTDQWIEKDPRSALAWADSLGESQLQQQVYQSTVYSLSKEDPAAAIDLAGKLHGLKTRRDAIREVTQQWFEDDALSAIAWLRSQPDHEFSDEIYRYALPRYANSDPEASAAYFDELVDQHGLTGNLKAAAGHIAYCLAENDPNGAITWVESIGDRSTMNRAIEQVIYSMADEHLEEAMQLATTRSELSVHAVSHLGKALASRDPGAAFEWIASQPDEFRRDAVRTVLRDLVRSNPAAAAEQLQASSEFLGEPDWNGLTKPADQIARALAMTDLEGALEWAANLPEGKVRNAAMNTPMHLWLQSDPRAASEWIGQLEDDSLRQQAAYQLAGRVRDSDPEAAYLWSQTLHENYRIAMMGEALLTWRETNVEAARRALEGARLTDEERATLEDRLSEE